MENNNKNNNKKGQEDKTVRTSPLQRTLKEIIEKMTYEEVCKKMQQIRDLYTPEVWEEYKMLEIQAIRLSKHISKEFKPPLDYNPDKAGEEK